MPITPVQNSGLFRFDNAAGGTFHMPGNFAAGNSAIYCCAVYNNNTSGGLTSVSIGGTAATKILSYPVPFGGQFFNVIEFWLAQNMTGGVDTVTVVSNANYYITGGCEELLASTIASSAFDKSGTNTGNSTTPSVTSATLSQADERAYAVTLNVEGLNIAVTSPGAPWSTLFNEPDGVNFEPGSGTREDVNSTAAITASWTFASAATWGAAIVTLKASVAVGGVSCNAGAIHYATP
jgi:hypothetical protein